MPFASIQRRIRLCVLSALIAGVLAVACAACGTGAGPAGGQPPVGAPPAAGGGNTPQQPSAPPVDSFVPDSAIRARRGSTGGKTLQYGDEWQDKNAESGNAGAGRALDLAAPAAGRAWALYRFPDLLLEDNPNLLTVQLSAAATDCYLAWSDYAPVAAGRQPVWRWQPIAGGPGNVLASLPAGAEPLSPGGNVYCLVALRGGATQLAGLELQLNSPAPPPVALNAIDGMQAAAISVTWIAPGGATPTGYLLERSLSGPGGPFVQIASTTPGVLNYTDLDSAANPIPADTQIYYRARTTVAGRPEGGPAGPTDAGSRHLGDVETFAASDGMFDGYVSLSWSPVSGASGYDVEYKLASDPDSAYALLEHVASSSTTFVHDEASPVGKECAANTVYSYRVRARWRSESSAAYSPPDTGYRNSPPLADLDGSPLSGPAPLAVDFDASGSADPDGGVITQYQWDWESDGTIDDSTALPLNSHTYTYGGNYSATVTAMDEEGSTATAALAVSAAGWGPRLTLASAGTYTTCLAVVNGNPAVSFDNGDTAYIRALDADGSSWGSVVMVDGLFGGNSSLAVVNGRPALSYQGIGSGQLRYARALDGNGASWGTPLTLDGSNTGLGTSLLVVGGLPAISYGDFINGRLSLRRATDAYGSAWDTVQVLEDTNQGGNWTSMKLVNGAPAIAYYDIEDADLKYVRASAADGSAWGAPLTLDSAGSTGIMPTLEVVAGRPAVAFYRTNTAICFIRATDADGSAWDSPVTVTSADSPQGYASLAVVGGNPAVSYRAGGNLMYCQASAADGSAWGTPETLDTGSDTGRYTSMAMVGGNPAISYINTANGVLKYVRLF